MIGTVRMLKGKKAMVDLIDIQKVLSLPRLTHRTLSGEIVAEYISVADIEALPEEPSAQPEQLTDKEQRIFLAAMRRETEVCEEVDKGHVREAYEDSLVYLCKEIKRKVKAALWT